MSSSPESTKETKGSKFYGDRDARFAIDGDPVDALHHLMNVGAVVDEEE